MINKIIETFLGNKINKLLGSQVDKIVDEISHAANNKLLEYLSFEYERNCKTKTILHRSEPIELSKFYQPLFLTKANYHWGRRASKGDKNKINTENVEKIFSKSNYITIIGNAGSGKSTLVKYLFVDSIRKDFRIPLKIELRYLNDYNGSIISYIKNEIIKFQEIAQSDNIINRILDSGEFVIFLDGYDEIVSDKKEAITKDIENLTKKYNKNHYILTSRPYVNIDLLECFHNYQVCDLSDNEINAFVKKQFNDNEQELAEKIIQTIKSGENNTYSSFLRNPLLLSMFIITYQTDSHIPQKRSDYYGQVFNALFSLHDTSSKLGYIREKQSGLSKENFIEVLKRFSIKSYFDGKYTFTEEYLRDNLDSIKQKTSFTFYNDDIISDCEVAIGILTQEGLDITFPHRSLQEYFAALFVSKLSNNAKEKLYEKLLDRFQKNNPFDDNKNFYLLLKEMDEECFMRYLIVPFLSITKDVVLTLKSTEIIIDTFMSIRNNSSLIDDKLIADFNSQHEKCNELFAKYIVDIKKENSEKAREILAQNDILIFIKDYDFQSIIDKIKRSIELAEKQDFDFVDSI